MKINENQNFFSLFYGLEFEKKEKIKKYLDILMEFNQKINLVSRKMNKKSLVTLINETLFLEKLITRQVVIDAGSGNGLLGIPIAILNREKDVILVELKRKKVEFLKKMKDRMLLENIIIYEGNIEEYNKSTVHKNTTLIARGFPKIEILFKYMKKGSIYEIIVVTSKIKILKIKKDMESKEQKIYNIPFKDKLVIFKMENVPRETE